MTRDTEGFPKFSNKTKYNEGKCIQGIRCNNNTWWRELQEGSPPRLLPMYQQLRGRGPLLLLRQGHHSRRQLERSDPLLDMSVCLLVSWSVCHNFPIGGGGITIPFSHLFTPFFIILFSFLNSRSCDRNKCSDMSMSVKLFILMTDRLIGKFHLQ